jgi:hypothetical protein
VEWSEWWVSVTPRQYHPLYPHGSRPAWGPESVYMRQKSKKTLYCDGNLTPFTQSIATHLTEMSHFMPTVMI